jgi:hypothetical protein
VYNYGRTALQCLADGFLPLRLVIFPVRAALAAAVLTVPSRRKAFTVPEDASGPSAVKKKNKKRRRGKKTEAEVARASQTHAHLHS